MNILGITLARGGSKGVKGKNIRKLNGYPLISYAIEKAVNSKIFSEVFVSTENEKIANVAKKFGAKIFLVAYRILLPLKCIQPEGNTICRS